MKILCLKLVLLAVVISSLFINVPPALSLPVTSVVGKVISQVKVTNYSDRVSVANGQFIYDLYKGTAGYDKIYYPDSSVAVYDSRFVLEYLQGANWKQRGVPTGITYNESSVTRHYDDSLGTTFDVVYSFTADLPVKITINIHSGATAQYRLIWSPSGITQNSYTPVTDGIDFGTIKFDWSDVRSTLGNITTYLVTTVAQGRKADVTFSVGNINAGQTLVIDPSVAGTSTSSTSTKNMMQNKTFYFNGRHWVFYAEGGDHFVWRTSTDGTNWSAATEANTSSSVGGVYGAIHFDGTYVQMAYIDDANDVYYRRGVPNANGTITWSANAQLAFAGSCYLVGISVSSTGIVYIVYDDASNNPYVIRNSNTDGTWSTTATYPIKLDTKVLESHSVAITDLGSGNMYAAWQENGASSGKLFGSLYTSATTSWSAVETVYNYEIAAASWDLSSNNNDEVYAVVWDGTNADIYSVTRSGGSWAARVSVSAQAATYTLSICKFLASSDIVVFWSNTSTDHVYYIKRVSGTWDVGGATDWIDASAATDPKWITVSEHSYSGYAGVVYQTGAGSPYNVNYAYLSDLVAPTVTNAAADTITETGAKLYGEITATGGANSTERGFEWDTNSGAPYANTYHTDGNYGTGTFNYSISSLPPNTTIYWRAWAANSAGTGYSSERNFTTLLPLPNAPINFTATETGTNEVTLSWTKGTYATTTVIREKEDSYPTAITQGYEVYNGAGTSVVLTGKSIGTTTYCYSAWSHNATGYSTTYITSTIGGTKMQWGFVLFFLGFLGAIMTYVGLKNHFRVVMAFAGLIWIGEAVFWHNNLPSFITSGSATDNIIMLILGGAGLLMIVASFGDSKEESISGKSGLSISRVFKFGSGKPVNRKANWQDSADSYRAKSQNALEGRRTVNRRRGIR